jgi:hypothetical protein
MESKWFAEIRHKRMYLNRETTPLQAHCYPYVHLHYDPHPLSSLAAGCKKGPRIKVSYYCDRNLLFDLDRLVRRDHC